MNGSEAINLTETQVHDIVDRIVEEGNPKLDEIAALYDGVDARSDAGSYVRSVAHKLSQESSNGIAEIHAQIGMDASSCPLDCEFCSFASCNGLRPPKLEMPKSEILEYAKRYEDMGINLLCLMVTSAYDFDQFLEMGAAVKEVIDPSLPLMANIDDFNLEQAKQLKAAGFDAIYHVIHMGEGEITSISPETRIQTINYAQAAGLTVSSCVEPIGRDHTGEEVAKALFRVKGLGVLSTGAGMRVPVPGSKFANDKPFAREEWGLANAICRLAMGDKVKLVGSYAGAGDSGANYGWVEVGTNPRDATDRTEKEEGGMGQDTMMSKKAFEMSGYQVLEGPSQGWRI